MSAKYGDTVMAIMKAATKVKASDFKEKLEKLSSKDKFFYYRPIHLKSKKRYKFFKYGLFGGRECMPEAN
jgi:hypothetical protein